MTTLLSATTAACLLMAALFLYLSSPHQRLFNRELPRRRLAFEGLVLALALLYLLSRSFAPAISVFILFSGLMLLWTLPPLLIAWLRHGAATRMEEGSQ